ncbi:hypothetical protein ACOXXX_18160 [Thalassococcus sp. BH17M4-6]|uniref:hypothetical protein n=1 Tax=Thalassococcus sp. BH17M4-6 TaxID=3413148 RepID=UPI003BCD8E96
MGVQQMPVTARFTGTITSGAFGQPAGAVSIVPVATAAGDRIAVAQYGYGATLDFDLARPGLPSVLATHWHSPASRVALSIPGEAGAALPRSVIATAQAAWETGNRDGQLAYLSPGALQGSAATVLAVEHGAQDLLFVAPADGSGISAFVLGATGNPGARQVRADSGTQYLGNVSDLAVIETDQGRFLYAGSASEHGVSGYRISSGGSLTPVAHLGREQSLPVQTVTALEAAEVAGQDFLIVAAAGSNSLTVLEVAAGGTLSVSDHLIDGRDTRFAGATQLDVITIDGHVFVIAAGSDDGFSVFALTPQGRLVHLDTVEDTNGAALQGVSGLAAQAVPGGFEILTTAANEPGLSLFRVDFSSPGLVVSQASGRVNGSAADDMLSLDTGAGTILAGAGDDILSDGPGADRLTGGAGADTFVLQADGQRDVITDIRPGQDVLDLSAWGFLYDIDQLQITSMPYGALIGFGDEVLELRRDTNAPLTEADIARLLPVMLSRIDVRTGALQEAVAPPDPNPDSGSVPPPDPIAPAPAPPPAPPPAPTPPPAPAPAPAPVPQGQNLRGGAGADSLSGGNWDDTIDGGAGNDTLRGGAGNDGIKGRGGNDMIYGGPGDDRLPGEAGNDRIYGAEGNDRLGGGPGHDLMVGGDGNDRGGGGDGNDTLQGDAGDDIFSGGAGTDLVEGGDGNDRLAGSWGDDSVNGDAGDDTMGGGAGNDFMRGGPGDDVIGAGEHHDTVRGGPGDDFIGGGAGNDYLRGNEGDDTLNGGYGNDTLSGGTGSDTFVFNALSGGGRGLITDFEDGTDLLRLVGRNLPGSDPVSRLDITDVRVDGEDAARILYGDHTILVLGVSASDLDADDFLFT